MQGDRTSQFSWQNLCFGNFVRKKVRFRTEKVFQVSVLNHPLTPAARLVA
jgi:hypothetical protein